jgi:hypothetical protein
MATKSSEVKTDTQRVDVPAGAASAPALVAEVSAQGPLTPTSVANLAADLVGRSTTLASDGAETPPPPAAKSDVTDALTKGGPAFGSFLKSIGMAVADTQAALDKTMGETAKMLSTTTVEIAQAYQQVLDENGELDEEAPGSGAVMTKMPLIAFVPVTAYQIMQLHLTADMDVSEFNTTNGFNIKKDHVGFDVNANANYGIFSGFNAHADTALKTTFDNDSERRFTGENKAAGKLHMEATIEPRHDIQLPKPYLVQKGPKLRLTVLERKDITSDPADPTKVTGRTVTISAHLAKQDGSNLKGKSLDVACDGNFVCTVANNGVTGEDGTVRITVERSGLTPESNTPVTTSVRASMKLVTANTTISL